jgi:predicted DNA-binding transcriptional regulator AlpA
MPRKIGSVQEAKMLQSRQNVGTPKTLSGLYNDLLQIEKQIGIVREFLRTTETNFREHSQSLAQREDMLVARIVDAVSSMPAAVLRHVNDERKRYVREKEAAQYMGVSVSALRSWRIKRSNNGPPYTRLGRMVLYRVSEIDEHMQTRTVEKRLR